MLLHTAAWVAVSQTVWWEAGFLEIMTLAMGMLLIIGIPTLLIAIFAVWVHNRMDTVRFRVLLAFPLVVCACPLLASSASEPLVFQVMAQIAFAALVPTPFFPAGWLEEAA
ncbi:hypothetical protein [Streptomyces incarnatus]|uniref:hypothetical protein n=1 Tax=Streptomyces incarnatus TaxID=665007 RepID=UPI001AD827A5|nr:hypothetical protein [Streptomyces incarnatus]